MGVIVHNAIVVTGGLDEDVKKAHKKATKLFEGLCEVSPIMDSCINGYYSFFIPPDGSKEGWKESYDGDEAREKFIEWLNKEDRCLDYVEIQYGGDVERPSIV